MDPITVREHEAGAYTLWLDTAYTVVDDVIMELGHEPNGYFWEGIVQLLVSRDAPVLEGRFTCDPEAGAFCAYSDDRAALEDLAERLRNVTGDAGRIRGLIESAEAEGFEFDD